MSSNSYKECVPSDNPDYFDGVVRPTGGLDDKDAGGESLSRSLLGTSCTN